MLLYFNGLSLRAVREFLLHKGYKVSIETIRELFYAVGKALRQRDAPLTRDLGI
jgi:transposase-like protein